MGRPPTHGYVYIIKADSGHYKIGKSIRPAKRVGEFTLQLPFKIEMVHVMACDNYTSVEKFLHRFYKPYHVNGEWFNLSPELIGWLMEFKWVSVAGLYDIMSFLTGSRTDPGEAATIMLAETLMIEGWTQRYQVRTRRYSK